MQTRATTTLKKAKAAYLKKGKADYDAHRMTVAAKDYIETEGVRLGYLDKIHETGELPICELCQRAYEPEEINGVRKLKEFKGYTVDLRLQEFREMEPDELPVFLEFASSQGKKLLA